MLVVIVILAALHAAPTSWLEVFGLMALAATAARTCSAAGRQSARHGHGIAAPVSVWSAWCSSLLAGGLHVQFWRGPARFRSAGRRGGGVLVEEAYELGAGVRPAGVGVGTVRGTTGPGVPAVVDGPALGQGRARGVLVAD